MLGVLTGIVTGLSPGLHANNVAALVLATEPAFAVLALIPLRAVLSDPIGLADHFRPWSAVFLAFVLGALLVSESRGGKARRVWRAAWVQAIAAALGVATLRGPTPLDAGVILF